MIKNKDNGIVNKLIFLMFGVLISTIVAIKLGYLDILKEVKYRSTNEGDLKIEEITDKILSTKQVGKEELLEVNKDWFSFNKKSEDLIKNDFLLNFVCSKSLSKNSPYGYYSHSTQTIMILGDCKSLKGRESTLKHEMIHFLYSKLDNNTKIFTQKSLIEEIKKEPTSYAATALRGILHLKNYNPGGKTVEDVLNFNYSLKDKKTSLILEELLCFVFERDSSVVKGELNNEGMKNLYNLLFQ